MSDFSFISVGRFDVGFERDEIVFASGTITDVDNDDNFEAGDGGRVGATYVGTTVVDGVTMPVYFSTLRNQYEVFNPGPTNVTWPTAITVEDEQFPFCFLAGTRIVTPDGERSIETLRIGDLIVTSEGHTVPVRWIGTQTVSTRFGPADRLRPVRVSAGALGNGLPLRDLTLTADHALLIDGLLINAGALVNGTTIDFVPLSELGDTYTVYHIETEAHDVILAEGTPAETYIDYLARRAFDNYDEYVALCGEDRTIPEMPHPRISSARQLPPALATRLGVTRAA